MRTAKKPLKNTLHIPDALVNRIAAICADHDVSLEDFIVGAIFSAIIAFERNNNNTPVNVAKKKPVKKAPTKKAAPKKATRKKAVVKKKAATKKRAK